MVWGLGDLGCGCGHYALLMAVVLRMLELWAGGSGFAVQVLLMI